MPNAGSSHYGMLKLSDSDVWGCNGACKNRHGLMCTLWPPRSCPPPPSIPGPFCCLSSGKRLRQPQSNCVAPDPPKADYFCCTICKSCLCIYKSPLFPVTSSSSPLPTHSFSTISENENKRTMRSYLEHKQTKKGESQGEAGWCQSHSNKRFQLITCKLRCSIKQEIHSAGCWWPVLSCAPG